MKYEVYRNNVLDTATDNMVIAATRFQQIMSEAADDERDALAPFEIDAELRLVEEKKRMYFTVGLSEE